MTLLSGAVGGLWWRSVRPVKGEAGTTLNPGAPGSIRGRSDRGLDVRHVVLAGPGWWHRHSPGQTLHVTEGTGVVATRDRVCVRPGVRRGRRPRTRSSRSFDRRDRPPVRTTVEAPQHAEPHRPRSTAPMTTDTRAPHPAPSPPRPAGHRPGIRAPPVTPGRHRLGRRRLAGQRAGGRRAARGRALRARRGGRPDRRGADRLRDRLGDAGGALGPVHRPAAAVGCRAGGAHGPGRCRSVWRSVRPHVGCSPGCGRRLCWP